jgi:hypothetical protein
MMLEPMNPALAAAYLRMPRLAFTRLTPRPDAPFLVCVARAAAAAATLPQQPMLPGLCVQRAPKMSRADPETPPPRYWRYKALLAAETKHERAVVAAWDERFPAVTLLERCTPTALEMVAAHLDVCRPWLPSSPSIAEAWNARAVRVLASDLARLSSDPAAVFSS